MKWLAPESLLLLLALALAGLGPVSTRLFAQDAESADWTQEELEQESERIRGQIEALRGQQFLRPVEVHLTDADGFQRYMVARMERLVTPEELADEEAGAKLLGLVPAEMDVWDETMKLLHDQVGGFYDPSSDAFYLMKSFTGPVARIIMAHELTHALDDQHYDIDGTLGKLLDDSDAANAFHAVVEGSGMSAMTRWWQEYGRDLSIQDVTKAMDVGTEELSKAPPYLWKPLLNSYNGGLAFLTRGYHFLKREKKDMTEVVRRAFEHPPLSTEQILHPDKYWKRTDWDAPRGIEHVVGELPEGWSVAEERTLGEVVLAILVDEATGAKPVDLGDPLQVAGLRYTNEAASGWGGDALILLEKGDARLAQVVTLWDREQDAREFRAALEGYADAWEARLAAFDPREAGHGARLLEASRPDEVRFAAWKGVGAEEAASVLAALDYRELPRAEPPPDEDEAR